MVLRIAPVRLAFNLRTLWFDAGDKELNTGDDVVVSTARGFEFGTISASVFEMDEAEADNLKSPLKPVIRIADEADRIQAEEMAELSKAALPIFRQMAAELAPDMNPVSVEYLFDGDKAVFYFDSEERVDFRDLVRKLAAELHVRVDMKQIGVRDGARMIGGLGHCGQELCCRRLGGEFNPVSIRMAKEQDLSLNPQKISGVCGRLMCCLRYEYDAYKDFHSRAPKKNARIQTPDGEGKVVDLDVPREIVSIKVGDEKPVKVPLAEMEPAEEGARPNMVGVEAWDRANEPSSIIMTSALNLFSNQLTGEDKLAEPGSVRHVHEEDEPKRSRSRSRRRGGSSRSQTASQEAQEQVAPARKPRRRRSTTVKSDGTAQTERQQAGQQPGSGQQSSGHQTRRQPAHAADESAQKASTSRRRRRGSSNKQHSQAPSADQQPKKVSQVGRNSSALRAGRGEGKAQANGDASKPQAAGGGRRRRRSHKTGSGGAGATGGVGAGGAGGASSPGAGTGGA